MSISKLNFNERSLLFAKLSSIAYSNIKEAKGQAKKLGLQPWNSTIKMGRKHIVL